MDKKIAMVIMSSVLLVLILPPVLAQFGWNYGYYNSPLAYLDNEWVRFTILFLLLFAVIYFAVNKTFKNNMISMIVAVGLSLLISIALGQKGLLYSYAGDALGDLAIVFGFLIALFAVFKVLMENFEPGKGFAIGLVSTIILMSFVDLNTILPSRYYYGSPLGNLLDNLTSFLSGFAPVLIPIGIVIVIMIFFKRKRRDEEGSKNFRKMLGFRR